MKVRLLLPDLSGGGAERVAIRVGAGLSALGHDVRLWVLQPSGALRALPSVGVPVDALGARSAARAVPRLRELLDAERPDALIANMTHMGFAAIAANGISKHKTKVIVVEHNTLSVERAFSKRRFERAWPYLAAVLYRFADHVVGVSQGVAQDLTQCLHLPEALVSTIYNPVLEQNQAPPVVRIGRHREILWCGRLVEQKRPDVMLDAFNRIRDSVPARLTMLGDGPLMRTVRESVSALAFEEDVALPGFALDTSPYFRRADTLVLTSDYEGLGNVLIEALSHGLRVVSTDCPNGPREILEGLRGTRLVPPGDAIAIAKAVDEVALEELEPLQVRERLSRFSARTSIDSYDRLLHSVMVP